MPIQRKKFELSPSLRLGVGRGHSNKILKYSAIFCLLLAVVLAGYSLRLIFQNGHGSVTSASPQVLGASDTRASNSQPTVIEYTVAKGDTLFNISQKFNISWTALATLNNLKNPFSLKLGQVLQIPQ